MILVAVGSAMLLGSVDSSVVNVALPTLARDLHAPFHLVQWTVLSFLMGVASLMLSMGRLGDMVGKKRVFMTGLVIFLLASGLCGFAPGIYWLIVFRFMQAIGAAMTMSLGVAIVTETWPLSERGTALGISAGIFSLGAMAGPALGGLTLHLLSWRWIFFINLPIGLIALVMVGVFVPASLPAQHAESFDFAGAALSGLTMFAFVLSMTFTQTRGLISAPVLTLAAVSLVSLTVFLWWEQRAPYPMLDLSMFRNSVFRLNLFTGLSTYVSASGVLLLFPFYLQLVRGLAPQQIGMVLAVIPITLAIWGPISGICSDHFGTRPVSLVGLGSMLAGYLMLCRLTVSSSPLAFVLLQIPMGLGMATFQSPNNASIMSAVPRKRLGIANSMLAMTRSVGQLAGISLLGTFFFCRLQVRTGSAVELTRARPAAIVLALHDLFCLSAALLAAGTGVAIWQAIREGREKKAGKTRPAGGLGSSDEELAALTIPSPLACPQSLPIQE
jgi:EmrB/QacA subfamily drug resistance transporter